MQIKRFLTLRIWWCAGNLVSGDIIVVPLCEHFLKKGFKASYADCHKTLTILQNKRKRNLEEKSVRFLTQWDFLNSYRRTSTRKQSQNTSYRICWQFSAPLTTLMEVKFNISEYGLIQTTRFPSRASQRKLRKDTWNIRPNWSVPWTTWTQALNWILH